MSVIKCHRVMQRLAQSSGQLPISLFVEDVRLTDPAPVMGGGFADVYIGSYGNQKVALKALRIYIGSDKVEEIKFAKVRYHLYNER